MLRPFEADRYTGTRGWPMFAAPVMGPMAAGHCRRCGAPSGECRCGCRECRREAKELLVEPTAVRGQEGTPGTNQASPFAAAMLQRAKVSTTGAAAETLAAGAALGTGTGFIGGGCCTSLSVEYAPTSATVVFAVLVEVVDSEGTAMLWLRLEQAGTPYRVKECIITTKPGAKLTVLTINCTARVRWCEIFSCGC